MNTTTCKDMGGPCDTVIPGATKEELVTNGMAHVEAAHPEMVADIKAMTPEQAADWDKKLDAHLAAPAAEAAAEAPAATM